MDGMLKSFEVSRYDHLLQYVTKISFTFNSIITLTNPLMKTSNVLFVLLLALLVSFSQCGSLKSTTYLKPNERFLLGDNRHRAFWVSVKNNSESMSDIEIHRAPVDGGRHSGQTLKAGESVLVKVEPNTALVVTNNSTSEASVRLKVRGDTDLSMGYRANR